MYYKLHKKWAFLFKISLVNVWNCDTDKDEICPNFYLKMNLKLLEKSLTTRHSICLKYDQLFRKNNSVM